MNFVNFDNSATTFPKPPSVAAAVQTAFTRYGGNPGRGGHKLSVATSEQVFKTRAAAADMFGAQPQNAVFAANCTAALNMAIKGMMQYGGHIIISDYEHNSVFRPVYALYKRRGATFSVAQISDSDEETVENFRRLIRSDTKCICCMAASNVTGRLMPIRELAELCRSYGICFITDAAQAAGLIDLKVGGGVSFMCFGAQGALRTFRNGSAYLKRRVRAEHDNGRRNGRDLRAARANAFPARAVGERHCQHGGHNRPAGWAGVCKNENSAADIGARDLALRAV